MPDKIQGLSQGSKKFLVVGYGNVLRGDDGAGIEAVKRIQALNLKNVETRLFQQLHMELLEEACFFDHVIFADAAIHQEEVLIQTIGDEMPGVSSSHQLNPGTFVHLARILYQKDLDVRVCSIRADNFEIGTGLSDSVLRRVDDAVERISQIVTDS